MIDTSATVIPTTTNSITNDIAQFMRAKAAHFFSRYTDEALLDYILFHLEQGTMAYAIRNKTVTGIMVGWAQNDPQVVPFAWQRHQPCGRFWYWHIYAAATSLDALALARFFFERHPECLARECLFERHDRTRRLPAGAVLRIYEKGMKYGQES